MSGGTINGNTATYGSGGGNGRGGGVLAISGTFRKIPGVGGNNSGIIYGSDATGNDANGIALSNTASEGVGNVVSGGGGRDTTADQTDYIDTSTGQGLSLSGDPPFGE
jgi:hypothetical protein